MGRAVTEIRTRQQERSDLSTKRLLEAAGELIAEGGYQAATLAAVGERAGYSRGLVTAKFGSKEKLLEALIERITTRWSHRNVLPQTEGRPGREQVVILLDAIRAQAAHDARSLRILYALMFEALGPVPELRRQIVAIHRVLRADVLSFLRRGLKDGSVSRRVSPEREAELIVAALRGIAYQWALDPECFDPVPALTYLVAVTDERLRPDPNRGS